MRIIGLEHGTDQRDAIGPVPDDIAQIIRIDPGNGADHQIGFQAFDQAAQFRQALQTDRCIGIVFVDGPEHAAAGGIINRFVFQRFGMALMFDGTADNRRGSQNQAGIMGRQVALAQMHALCTADFCDIDPIIDQERRMGVAHRLAQSRQNLARGVGHQAAIGLFVAILQQSRPADRTLYGQSGQAVALDGDRIKQDIKTVIDRVHG